MMQPVATFAWAAAAALAFAASTACAQDQLKVAIGQINNWENQAPTLGQDAGIFKKHGLVLETVGTAGAGETLQPVIAGSADIGAGVGVLVRQGGFADQEPQGCDGEEHDCLFHQRLELQQSRHCLRRRAGREGEADRDR
jgi:hypothetical protein